MSRFCIAVWYCVCVATMLETSLTTNCSFNVVCNFLKSENRTEIGRLEARRLDFYYPYQQSEYLYPMS